MARTRTNTANTATTTLANAFANANANANAPAIGRRRTSAPLAATAPVPTAAPAATKSAKPVAVWAEIGEQIIATDDNDKKQTRVHLFANVGESGNNAALYLGIAPFLKNAKTGVYTARRGFSIAVANTADAADVAEDLIQGLQAFKDSLATVKTDARTMAAIAANARKAKIEKDEAKEQARKLREEKRQQAQAEKERKAAEKAAKAATTTTSNRRRVTTSTAMPEHTPAPAAQTETPNRRRRTGQAADVAGKPVEDKTPAAPIAPRVGRTRPRSLGV